MTTGGELEQRVTALTWLEIEMYTAMAWPVLLRLTADERERLRRELLDGTWCYIEEARGKHSAADPVDDAALQLMRHFAPKDAADLAGYLGVLVGILTLVRGSPDLAPQPPPVTVIINEIPQGIRPTEPRPRP
ncbi:MAG: hypothetical protein ACRDRV_06295 [Pseudonocardiaceae bacterium]